MQQNDDESGALGCAVIVVVVLVLIALIWLAIHHGRW
jgi:hypothetical protein